MFRPHRTTATKSSARNILVGSYALTVFLLGSVVAQATPVTVNLGQSAEEFVEHGLGPDMSTGRGTYALDQGSCAFDGTNTTCTLSGAFTGLTSGFTAGTYTFVTKYAGTGLSPIRAISTAGNPDLFEYLHPLPSSTSMTLNLSTADGQFVAPLVSGGVGAAPDVEFDFTYVTVDCSGTSVATCTPGNVGLTNGAIGQGPVTAVVTFDDPPPTTTTSTTSTTTTTTLATGCVDAAATYDSILCRIQALLARVQAEPGLGPFQSASVKTLDQAKARIEAARALGNNKRARKRLQQAGAAVAKYVHRLGSLTARKKLPSALRVDFQSAGQHILPDLKTLRSQI